MADDNEETNAATATVPTEEAAARTTAASASEDVVPDEENDTPVTADDTTTGTTNKEENGETNTQGADGTTTTTTVKAEVDVTATTTTMSTEKEDSDPVKEETTTEEAVVEAEDTKPEETTTGDNPDDTEVKEEEATTTTAAVDEPTTAATTTTKEEEDPKKDDEESPKDEETEIKEEVTTKEEVEPTDDNAVKKDETTEAMDIDETKKEEETKEDGGEKPPPQDAPMEDADKPAETSPAGRAGKRIRKSVEAYNPTSYASETISGPSRASLEGLEQLQVPEGRGTTLDNMEIVKESIEGHAERDAEILAVAHRVIFGGRGKFIVTKQPKKKEVMTQSILQFSGYLKPITSEFDETKRLKAEDMEKKKYEDRLMKWQKDTLVDLCHFFALDVSAQKGKPQSKDDIIQKLLEFLSAPSEELVNNKVVFRKKHQLKMDTGKRASRGSTGSSKKTPGKKGAKKKMKTSKGSVKPNKNSPYAEWDTDEDEEEEEESEEESEAEGEGEEESEEEASDDDDEAPPPKKRGRKSKATPTKSSPKKLNGKMPSETAIKEWVEHYVGCFNLNKVTTNHALATATDKFHCDMTPKKPMIKELLKNAILYQM